MYSMKRWAMVVAVFLLGVGASQLATFLFSTRITSQKLVEITKEATTTAVLSGAQTEETAVVSRVIDGDTVELADGRRLRYIGMDTPELVDPRKPVECFANEAKEENKRLVDGKKVRLEKDVSQTDKYSRLLRYVWVGDVMVNDYLVRQGFAHASAYPPDVTHSEQLLEAEREAREHHRGLWSGCPVPTP